jgi:hypothetical protein
LQVSRPWFIVSLVFHHDLRAAPFRYESCLRNSQPLFMWPDNQRWVGLWSFCPFFSFVSFVPLCIRLCLHHFFICFFTSNNQCS